MNTSAGWGHVLLIIGLIAMLVGALDPLEGSLIILPGSGIAALGALLTRGRRRKLVYWGFALIAVGVGAMFVLSAFGGTGGRTGRSNWWLLVVLPYPVGWVTALAGVLLNLRERRQRRTGAEAAPQK